MSHIGFLNIISRFNLSIMGNVLGTLLEHYWFFEHLRISIIGQRISIIYLPQAIELEMHAQQTTKPRAKREALSALYHSLVVDSMFKNVAIARWVWAAALGLIGGYGLRDYQIFKVPMHPTPLAKNLGKNSKVDRKWIWSIFQMYWSH